LEEQMISVTERAATALADLLADNDAPAGQGVRLVPRETGTIGMTIGAPADGDDVIRRGEEPLLIVDVSLGYLLDGATIDCATTVVKGQPTTQFRLAPPAPKP
jgi:Fe-S cluster assembly iron-binding protein IscA